MKQTEVQIGNFKIGNKLPLALLAGPCQIESRQHAIEMAGKLIEITKEVGINYVFKASFDKANRTSIHGARGVGIEEGLRTFEEIKKLYGCPIVTDIHERDQVSEVAKYVDVLQIPAFLCRQTDLVVAAAQTGKVINVKKGQFLAPWDMKNVVNKIFESGNENACITERGTSFGYNTLVNDLTGFPQMAEQTGCPIVFDVTHSVQKPGGNGASTGGNRDFVPPLARAGVAVGVAAVFIEAHENPDKAFSDGPNSMYLKDMKGLLETLKQYDALTKGLDLQY